MGREAQQAGAAFEAWIETQHTIAERLGILAHVEHNEPHSKVINGRLMFERPGVADYSGTLDRSGLTFAAEAKSTKADKLAKSAVEPKQQRHLEAVARAGGLALLLVEFRVEGVRTLRYAIPWLAVPWEIGRTKENLYLEKCLATGWGITVVPGDGKCYLSTFHTPGARTSTGSGRVRRFARE